MPLRSDWSSRPCPIARGLDLLGDPWTLMVLRELFLGNNRFDDIKARLGVADNVLSKRLAALVDDGMAAKEPYADGGRTRYRYRLTPKGEDTLPILNAVAIWSEKHTPAPDDRAHMFVLHTGCGNRTSSADTCSSCGERLSAATTSWHSLTRSESPVQLRTAAA